MVRVISVHHFASQNIQTVEQPTACTVATPDKLLLALTNNCIEVRDLKNGGDLLFSFPSVDEVIQIVHCRNGDYVATLETKFNRQNRDTNFVRAYINWDSVAALQQSKMTSSGVSLGLSECGMVQPMRARIAGRVTPTTNQSEVGNLEMIEIPVKRNPNYIDCCQISGNFCVVSGCYIDIYQFVVETHDISKMRFIDFMEIGIGIELGFCPVEVAFSENYIACMGKDSMFLFKLVSLENSTNNNGTREPENNFCFIQDDSIDFKNIVAEELLGHSKDILTVHLPSITRDNSIIHKHSPFTFTDKEMKASLYLNTPNVKIENLIQLKLIPILVESPQRQITEEFKCMSLKPLYIQENLIRSTKRTNILRSNYENCLNGVVCMIATQQEGYLHYFSDNDKLQDEPCITIYPFTAPIQQLVIEDYFLHALTETGLESYTLRYGHKLFRTIEQINDVTVACPSINDSICLVGLRPFLGVERVLLSENYLVLLANSETSPTHSVSSNSSSNACFWTLYDLELPTPKTTFNDISILANVHRFSSAQTYCHLLSEAHVILRLALVLKQWSVVEENVKLVLAVKSNIDDVVDTYKMSCALLGDHYIMSSTEEEFKLAIPYYKMARVSPIEVLHRVKKIQHLSNDSSVRGLMCYIKNALLENLVNEKYFMRGSQKLSCEDMLSLIEMHDIHSLPDLILRNRLLRSYYNPRLTQILQERFNESGDFTAHKLALCILYIQYCQNEKAQECLLEIRHDILLTLVKTYWELLFNDTGCSTKTFSEFGILLINTYPDLVPKCLVSLIFDKKVMNLNKITKAFLEYLPSSDSRAGKVVFQKTLENYFDQYFQKLGDTDLSKIVYGKGSNEAIKLLVRSYLSELKIVEIREQSLWKMSSNTEDVTEKADPYFEDKKRTISETLFGRFNRYEFLNKMPPFQVEITSKLYQACLENYKTKKEFSVNEEADNVLKKLQAILCSQFLSNKILVEINAFLCLNENLRGRLSLQAIMADTNSGVLLLIDDCPQCLLQYGKDRFTSTDEWSFLVVAIQKAILRLCQNDKLNPVCFFYKKILNDVLTHVATSMSLQQLLKVFPQRFNTIDDNNKFSECFGNDLLGVEEILNEIQNYESFVVICKETMHANQISSLIKTTGQQLLSTLNL